MSKSSPVFRGVAVSPRAGRLLAAAHAPGGAGLPARVRRRGRSGGCRSLINEAFDYGKYLYVYDLVTGETGRSSGQGGALLEFLKTLARDARCKQLHLDSSALHFGAHGCYRREVFVISPSARAVARRNPDARTQTLVRSSFRGIKVRTVLPEQQQALTVDDDGVRQQGGERSEVSDHNHHRDIWGEGHGATLDLRAPKKRENVVPRRVKIPTYSPLLWVTAPLEQPDR